MIGNPLRKAAKSRALRLADLIELRHYSGTKVCLVKGSNGQKHRQIGASHDAPAHPVIGAVTPFALLASAAGDPNREAIADRDPMVACEDDHVELVVRGGANHIASRRRSMRRPNHPMRCIVNRLIS